MDEPIYPDLVAPVARLVSERDKKLAKDIIDMLDELRTDDATNRLLTPGLARAADLIAQRYEVEDEDS